MLFMRYVNLSVIFMLRLLMKNLFIALKTEIRYLMSTIYALFYIFFMLNKFMLKLKMLMMKTFLTLIYKISKKFSWLIKLIMLLRF